MRFVVLEVRLGLICCCGRLAAIRFWLRIMD